MDLGRTLAAAALLLATHAANAADSGFYFGVLGGQTKYDFEQPQIPVATPTLPPGVVIAPPIFGGVMEPGFVINATPFVPFWMPGDDDEATAWGAIAGYRIMRYAAVEVSYLNLGKLEETDTFPGFPPILPPTQLKRSLATTGPTLSALGILPVLDWWSVYVRAGVLFADMELKSSIDGSSDSTTFGSESFLWGAGTQFDWGAHWSVRLDYQRFEAVGEQFQPARTDIDLLSLGVLFRL